MGTIVTQRVVGAVGRPGEAALERGKTTLSEQMSSLARRFEREQNERNSGKDFFHLTQPTPSSQANLPFKRTHHEASVNPFKSPVKPSAPSFKGGAIPNKLNNPQIVHDLWDAYFTKGVPWEDMMAKARELEEGRTELLKEWGIKPADYKPKSHENIVIRSGTDPADAEKGGRGVHSDEDLTANTLKAWKEWQTKAKAHGFEVQLNNEAGYFKIAELNTLVWKPSKYAPKPRQGSFGLWVNDPEVVPKSSNQPKIQMEHTLPLYKKGRRGLREPVENWGKNFGELYETLIQTAKSTHHEMEKSGVHKQEPEKFQRLWDLCKMRKSPEALGIFKPGQSEAKSLERLQTEQEDLRNLMARSYKISVKDLKSRLKYLKQHDPKYNDSPVFRNRKDTEDTHNRLRTVQEQFRVLSDHPKDSSSYEQQLFSKAPKLDQELSQAIRITDPTRGRKHSFGHHPMTPHHGHNTRRKSFPPNPDPQEILTSSSY
jgi:hypothetical protein